jgi:hypothetical protein
MIVAILLTTALLALSMGLVILANVESAIAANFKRGMETVQAADAGIVIAIGGLASAEWSDILKGVEPTCTTLEGAPVVAPTAFYPPDLWGANGPVWRLYSCLEPRGALTPDTAPRPPTVAVWLADDPSEADDDPILDTNRRLTVRAEAFGPRGAHAAIEATVAQSGPEMRILSWRVLR